MGVGREAWGQDTGGRPARGAEEAGAAGPPTPQMALDQKLPGQEDKYVSVVTNDDFNSFQRNGHNGDEFGDEEIDFTPQNGYHEPEEMEYEEVGPGRKAKAAKKAKPDLMGAIAAAGSAIKKARLPTPMELKEGYLNSAFHKSLHQPLIVKSKVEKEDVRVARRHSLKRRVPPRWATSTQSQTSPFPRFLAPSLPRKVRSLLKQNQCHGTWTSGVKQLTTPCQSPSESRTL